MKFLKASIVLLLIVSSGCISFCATKNIKHEIKERADGGYTIILSRSIRALIPITAEGFFPKKDIYYQIELKGTGKDRKFRNQPGFYYSYPDNIECKTPNWDLGYAWIDRNRKTIYLNLYWVVSSRSLVAAEVNGTYEID